MTLNNSLNKTKHFKSERYTCWKNKIKIIIEGTNIDIWDDVKNGNFVPNNQVNNMLENKSRIYGKKRINKKCNII